MILQSEFETALKAIDLEIENNPDNVEAWGTKATLLLKLAELTEDDNAQKSYYLKGVIESATAGLQKDNNEIRLWDLQATAYLQKANLADDAQAEKQDLNQALYAIEQALILNKDLAGFWFVKGLIYDRLNECAKATLAFDKATILKTELIDELPESYKVQYGKTSL